MKFPTDHHKVLRELRNKVEEHKLTVILPFLYLHTVVMLVFMETSTMIKYKGVYEGSPSLPSNHCLVIDFRPKGPIFEHFFDYNTR